MKALVSPSAKLEAVRAKIVEVVPDIREVFDRCMQCGYGYEFCKKTDRCRNPDYRDRPIHLADVLLALIESVDVKHHPHSPKTRDREYTSGTLRICGKWNLRQDSLDQQSDETVTFLHSLLCV